MRTTDGSGLWGHYQPDGSAVGFAAVFPSDALDCLGLVVTRGQRLGNLLDRFDGLLRSSDAPHLEVAEQCERGGDDDHEAEDDEERHPPPQPRVEELGEEEEEKERRVEEHNEREDEEDAAGEALLDVAGDLGLRQFHLGAHQRRHL